MSAPGVGHAALGHAGRATGMQCPLPASGLPQVSSSLTILRLLCSRARINLCHFSSRGTCGFVPEHPPLSPWWLCLLSATRQRPPTVSLPCGPSAWRPPAQLAPTLMRAHETGLWREGLVGSGSEGTALGVRAWLLAALRLGPLGSHTGEYGADGISASRAMGPSLGMSIPSVLLCPCLKFMGIPKILQRRPPPGPVQGLAQASGQWQVLGPFLVTGHV